MIRVHPAVVLAASKLGDAGLDVVEGHSEVLRVPTGGLQAEPGGSQDADPDSGGISNLTSGACCASSSTGTSRAAKTERP